MTEQNQPTTQPLTPEPSPLATEPAPPPPPPMSAAPPPPPPAKSGKMRQVITWAVILGVLGAVLWVVRDNVSAADLKVGQCIDFPAEDEFSTVTQRDCTQAHDGEIFHIAEYTGSTYPISLSLERFVDEQCVPAFATYVGASVEDREDLGIGSIFPSRDAWDDGNHKITCYLAGPDESKLTKSMKGTGA